MGRLPCITSVMTRVLIRGMQEGQREKRQCDNDRTIERKTERCYSAALGWKMKPGAKACRQLPELYTEKE